MQSFQVNEQISYRPGKLSLALPRPEPSLSIYAVKTKVQRQRAWASVYSIPQCLEAQSCDSDVIHLERMK